MSSKILSNLFWLLFCMISPMVLVSQNQLKNSNFETLRQPLPIEFFGNAKTFAYRVPNWQLVGSGPVLCTTEYVGNTIDKTSVLCAKGELVPYEGNVMLELDYLPQCASPLIGHPGCAAYVGQMLDKPLLLGKIYEFSMMVYIPTPDDPAFANHIGINVYNDEISHRANVILPGNELLLDTVIFNEWYRASWRIRPTCDLKFLVIGVFKNAAGPPLHKRKSAYNRYFIDDLILKEVKGKVEDIPPYCRTQPKVTGRQVPTEGETIFFPSGSAVLSSIDRRQLDTFAVRAIKNPESVFLVSGHTDATGDNHLELSNERINSTLQYLEQAHRISPLRFVRIPLGTDKPLVEEIDEAARRKNRRVEITYAGSEPWTVLYRHLLLAVQQNNVATATGIFRLWTLLVPEQQFAFARYDPRLTDFLSLPEVRTYWKDRLQKIYPAGKRLNGTKLLDSLWREDQLPRTLGRYIENMAYYVYPSDTANAYWDVSYPEMTPKVMAERDTRHAELVAAWLTENDWPLSSVVGATGAKAIPLVLLHSGNSLLMDKYLPTFYLHCRAGEGDWSYYALMYDRNQVLKNMPQRFGTQFANGSRLMLENSDSVNVWRYAIGMDTIRIR